MEEKLKKDLLRSINVRRRVLSQNEELTLPNIMKGIL
jgi:hypothetical protein